jgi:hypothetical protein
VPPASGVERSPSRLRGQDPNRGRLTPTADAVDRDHLLDRVQSLRTIVPVFAQELACARRQAAQLRVENRQLLEQVRQLQRERVSR